MKGDILILTSSYDLSVNGVIEQLGSAGENVFRFNTDRFPSEEILTLNLRDATLSVGIRKNPHGSVIRLEKVKSCWYRGASRPQSTFDGDEGYRRFIEDEARTAIWGLYTCLDVFWVNPPLFGSQLIGNNKLYQMSTAIQVGLKTPRTVITNDPEELLEFCRQCGGSIAVKTLSGHVMIPAGTRDVFAVYTHRVSEDDLLKRYEDLCLAPILAQEYVAKQLEFRVTVVGERIFACAIHSQDSERTKHDWRRYDLENVKHEQYDLPADVQDKLLAFMRASNLVFGAIDMILTPSGEYVFLEVNPSGQWGWIENLTGMPISQAIAELLANPPPSG